MGQILGDDHLQQTCAFTELQSYYLFGDRFRHPGEDNDKEKEEGVMAYARHSFLTEIISQRVERGQRLAWRLKYWTK